MSKNPVVWHEECYRDASINIQRDIEYTQRQLNSLLYRRAENAFRKTQIDEAKRRGMDGFDEERFMKKERAAYMEEIKSEHLSEKGVD